MARESYEEALQKGIEENIPSPQCSSLAGAGEDVRRTGEGCREKQISVAKPDEVNR
jgi:hypothetical protein